MSLAQVYTVVKRVTENRPFWTVPVMPPVIIFSLLYRLFCRDPGHLASGGVVLRSLAGLLSFGAALW